MTRILLLMFSMLINNMVISQKRQAISYEGKLYTSEIPLKNNAINVTVSIVTGSVPGIVIYKEQHSTKTDTTGTYQLEIGNGSIITGQFDSIIWSDGIFYLKEEIDTSAGNNYPITKNILMRIPPDLKNDYEQGTVTSSEYPDHGSWRFNNNRNKRPRLVTIDLTTSYANLAYPADTYPVYRHFEWCDPDRDGKGNSFVISYSDHTNNYFKENTTTLGEVKLYRVPFQELTISSTNQEIVVDISKPIPVSNHSETYAIKGPWKFIYYIEW